MLLTATSEDSEPIVRLFEKEEISLLHLPLERYVSLEERMGTDRLAEALEEAENIIYGHKRNAEFLIRMAKSRDLLEKIKQRVNLAADSYTATFLEEEGIPAVYPESDKPIKMVEFMLRLRRTGPTLYPCGRHGKEEIPGLLQELDIPVEEYELYNLEGPAGEELDGFRRKILNAPPDLMIFHSRRSVNRIQAAFPDLDYDKIRLVAGDRGVSDKMEKLVMKPDSIAEGTWRSIFEKVKELL